MPDKKLTDSEIIKACKDCLHYEACKGTYSSAKGDEDILYDFDGEMYANSGCEDFQDKDLINCLQAENERLEETIEVLRPVVEQSHIIRKDGKSPLSLLMAEIKAEAYKECIEKVKLKANKSNWVSSGVLLRTEYTIGEKSLDNLLKELAGEDNG